MLGVKHTEHDTCRERGMCLQNSGESPIAVCPVLDLGGQEKDAETLILECWVLGTEYLGQESQPSSIAPTLLGPSDLGRT